MKTGLVAGGDGEGGGEGTGFSTMIVFTITLGFTAAGSAQPSSSNRQKPADR
jgi:hypothetical protein